MTQICDYSSPQDLDVIAQHFDGIMRYVSDYTPKNITEAEFNEALAKSLTVTLVCEQGQQPALRGVAGGTHDALIANALADEVGYSPLATIYFVAEDPNQLPISQYPLVHQYFMAVNANAKRPVGAYGGKKLVASLVAAGLATKGWGVQTWGAGIDDLNLEQLVGADTFGLSIDVDQVLTSDYGQHPRPSTPLKEANVPVSPVVVWNGQRHTFQVSLNTLWHKWAVGTATPDNESLQAATGETALQFPDQTPQVAIIDNPQTGKQELTVVVEAMPGQRAWVFAQEAGAPSWQAWELA